MEKWCAIFNMFLCATFNTTHLSVIHREKWCAISSTFTCAISMSPVLAQFTCDILFSVLYLAHSRCAILSVLSNPIAPIKI